MTELEGGGALGIHITGDEEKDEMLVKEESIFNEFVKGAQAIMERQNKREGVGC